MNVTCNICKKRFPIAEVTPSRFVRSALAHRIAHDHAEWDADSFIFHDDLNHYRSQYVQSVLTEEKGELTSLECDVIESLKQHDILTTNLNAAVDDTLTVGERLADRVVTFIAI